jgi:hypothetical protein
MASREVTIRLVIDDERLRQMIAAELDARRVDEHCRLSGDEDCGVGVTCRTCDLGGKPVAYYPGISDVPTATGILHLYLLAQEHVRAQHEHG